DNFDAEITSATWTVSYQGGASGPASGSGNINVLLNMPVNSMATFIVVAHTSATATHDLVNTAFVSPPAGILDPNLNNNHSTVIANVQVPSTVSGLVFLDCNGNGHQDPGEPGLPGVTITLNGVTVTGDIVSAPVVTNINGRYTFFGLVPGMYNLV